MDELRARIKGIFMGRPNLMVSCWDHGMLISYDSRSIEADEMQALVKLVGPSIEVGCDYIQTDYVRGHYEMTIEAKLEPQS